MLNPRRTWDKHFVTFARAGEDKKLLQKYYEYKRQ